MNNETKMECLKSIMVAIDSKYESLHEYIEHGHWAIKDQSHLQFIGSLCDLPTKLDELKKIIESALTIAKQ